jgi:hypothetical protein
MPKDNSKQFLSREAILAISDTQIETIDVPEWNTMVRVRGLTAAERDQFEGEIVQRNGKDVRTNTKNIRARLVVLSVVDADGARLFTYHDIVALGEKSAKALDRIFSKAMELSGLRDEDVAELAENFDETPDAGSSSS